MNEHSRISEDDYMRSLQEYRNRFLNGSKTAGFYIQLAFVVGAVGIIAAKGVWNVMWTVLVALPLLLSSTVVRPAAWNWTERMLRRDAEEGRLTRAVWWDYLSVLIDALDCFVCSAIVSVAVFAMDDGVLALPLAWICAGAFRTLPFVYMRSISPYNWSSLTFWEQWAFITLVALSAFLPVTLPWGVALLLVFLCLSVSLSCLYQRETIWGKVNRYHEDAKNAKVLYIEPPATPSLAPEADYLKAGIARLELHWPPLTASVVLLAAGLSGCLWLRRPSALLATLFAVVLGYFATHMFSCPTNMEVDELTRRRIDVDLSVKFFDRRALVMMLSLAVASATVLWLGGGDARALVALSMAAAGACTITAAGKDFSTGGRSEGLSVVMYAVALAVVCAIRLAGQPWWVCLLPIPALSYFLPVYRWFFPRSGLRGAERRAAIAAMPARFEADIRTAAQKAFDEKREKRRLREARRLANIRRSRR